MSEVINGHPTVPLLDDTGEQVDLLTVCAECGSVRSILFLTGDRWMCVSCRVEGVAPPRLYPTSRKG